MRWLSAGRQLFRNDGTSCGGFGKSVQCDAVYAALHAALPTSLKLQEIARDLYDEFVDFLIDSGQLLKRNFLSKLSELRSWSSCN